jgi:hypothetical protein
LIDQTEAYTRDLLGNRVMKNVSKPATTYVDQAYAYSQDGNDRLIKPLRMREIFSSCCFSFE